ncbi:MAG: hypothetical protein LWW86_16330 [Micrococcales bacterium]|nr:hypothetical protein [Micrococcales bacterium]
MSVAEKVDPSSALVAPGISDQTDFVEELESSCGFILGHLLGFIRQAFGISPIEELVKPLVGDWTEMERAVGGWKQAELACTNVGQNFAALPEQTTAVWKGTDGDAFRSRMTSVSESYTTYGQGCASISELSQGLVDGAKAAAQGIATLISFIGDLIERLAVEASIPVVGWLVGAADVAIHIKSFWDKINKGYELLKKFLSIIHKVVSVLEKVNKVLSVIKTTLQGMGVAVQASTVASADDAAANAFGTA